MRLLTIRDRVLDHLEMVGWIMLAIGGLFLFAALLSLGTDAELPLEIISAILIFLGSVVMFLGSKTPKNDA